MEVVSAKPDTATLPPSAFVAFVAASKAKAHGEKDGYCDGFWTTFGSFFLSIAFGSFFFLKGWGDVFGGWSKIFCNIFGRLKREIHFFFK